MKLPKDREYVRCQVCRRVLIGRTPKGGDGSLTVPYPHVHEDIGSWGGRTKPCPGSKLEGEAVPRPESVQ